MYENKFVSLPQNNKNNRNMKKVLSTMMCFLLMIISAGCSDDSTENNLQDVENNIILPFEKDGLSLSILNFFNEEMPQNRIERTKGFFTSVVENEEVCVVINSDEEFQNAYKGDLILPTIDFHLYTLILGKLYLDASYMLEKQYIIKEESEHILVLQFKNKIADCEILPLYYWGIYPKFNYEKITIKKERI